MIEVSNFEGTLSEECRHYLRLFCQELEAGREGEREWDMFAVAAHKMQRKPDTRALLTWLTVNLKTPADFEAIKEDFERVGRLFNIGDELTKLDWVPESLRSQNLSLAMEMTHTAASGGMPLGLHAMKRMDNGKNKRLPLSLPPEARQTNPHVLAAGLQGKGKTGFLTRMIAHDIEGGQRAVVVLDSDGTLIDFIDNWISSHPRAEEFVDRTVIVDPTLETDNPTYNALEVQDEGDIQSTAAAVVSAFRARQGELSEENTWTVHTATILRNAIMLLACNGLTLADLPTLLLDENFREVLIGHLEGKTASRSEYRPLFDVWRHYGKLASSPQWLEWIKPILDRVMPMLSDVRVLEIINRRNSTLNLQNMISNKTILLVRLPQDQLDHSGDLLANLLITGLKRAAQTLAQDQDSIRLPCAVYVDYIDDLIGWQSVDSLIRDSKKHHLGFAGSAKSLRGLTRSNCGDVINGFGTVAAFAMERGDAEWLAPRMFRLDPDQIRLFNIGAVDQEKLHVELLTQQEPGRYFIFRVGQSAGMFAAQSPEYPFR